MEELPDELRSHISEYASDFVIPLPSDTDQQVDLPDMEEILLTYGDLVAQQYLNYFDYDMILWILENRHRISLSDQTLGSFYIIALTMESIELAEYIYEECLDGNKRINYTHNNLMRKLAQLPDMAEYHINNLYRLSYSSLISYYTRLEPTEDVMNTFDNAYARMIDSYDIDITRPNAINSSNLSLIKYRLVTDDLYDTWVTVLFTYRRPDLAQILLADMKSLPNSSLETIVYSGYKYLSTSYYPILLENTLQNQRVISLLSTTAIQEIKPTLPAPTANILDAMIPIYTDSLYRYVERETGRILDIDDIEPMLIKYGSKGFDDLYILNESNEDDRRDIYFVRMIIDNNILLEPYQYTRLFYTLSDMYGDIQNSEEFENHYTESEILDLFNDFMDSIPGINMIGEYQLRYFDREMMRRGIELIFDEDIPIYFAKYRQMRNQDYEYYDPLMHDRLKDLEITTAWSLARDGYSGYPGFTAYRIWADTVLKYRDFELGDEYFDVHKNTILETWTGDQYMEDLIKEYENSSSLVEELTKHSIMKINEPQEEKIFMIQQV